MGFVEDTGAPELPEPLLDYRIELPDGYDDVDNLQICFVKDADEFALRQELLQHSEKGFLDSHYVMIKLKAHLFGNTGASKILIYHLRNLKRPIV